MKWMAENFLAAWALHEACTCADTFCLLPAASADTAKDATSAVASVEISSFFMFVSPLLPNATETLNHAISFRIFRLDTGVTSRAPGDDPMLVEVTISLD
jgi:hypothetical protein